MNSFKGIIEDLLANYKRRLAAWSHDAQMRNEILTQMHNELKQLKETWEMLHPNQPVDYVPFEQIMKELA